MDTLELVVPATSCKRNAGDERQLVSSCGVLQLCVDALNPHNNLQSFDNSLSVCVCVCVCVCKSRSLSLSVCVCARVYIYLSIYLSIYPPPVCQQPPAADNAHIVSCLICMPCMYASYALCVYLICMPYMYALYVSHIPGAAHGLANSRSRQRARCFTPDAPGTLYVCLICMPYMYALYVFPRCFTPDAPGAHI